jgi:hypothetical protein
VHAFDDGLLHPRERLADTIRIARCGDVVLEAVAERIGTHLLAVDRLERLASGLGHLRCLPRNLLENLTAHALDLGRQARHVEVCGGEVVGDLGQGREGEEQEEGGQETVHSSWW